MTSEDKRRITSIIGLASCEGAGDVRCRLGPQAVHSALERGGCLGGRCQLEWHSLLSLSDDHEADFVSAAAGLYGRLAVEVGDLVRIGRFVAVYGGDHSCAIGTWSGVATAVRDRGAIGLIWIDAHMDAHRPDTSPSGNLHGMPVACLLGHGYDSLVAISGDAPALKPEHLVLIGVRSYEPEESEFLQQMGVTIYTMDDVHRLGLSRVMAEARETVSRGTVGYGISVDLDGLDPLDAPGVGSPVVGGIAGQDLLKEFSGLSSDERLLALEIVELNPTIDVEQRTVALAKSLLTTAIGCQDA